MRSEKAKYILAVCLYGTIGMLLRYISLPSEAVALCRGAVGTVTILLVMLCRGQKINWGAVRARLPLLLLSGAFLGLNWMFLFAAYQATTVAVASLCNYMAPIILIVISPFVFQERLTRRKLCCVLAALAGILLVSGVFENGGGVNPRGVGLGLAGALCFAAVVLCNKKLPGIDPLEKTAVQLAVSAAVLLPYVLFRSHGGMPGLDARSVVLLLVLGVVHTGFAYILYFGSMAKIPVQSVAILGYLKPVVAVLTSALVLREPITAMGAAGAVLILGAAVCSEIKRD